MKFIGTKQLETERLILKRVKAEYALEAYNNWCNDPDVTKYVFWDPHKDSGVTKNLYEVWEKEYEDLSTYRWIVEIKDTHELIGTIDNSSKTFMEYGVCEVGYCYGKKYWHKGYAKEALGAVIKFLFEECDVEVITAKHMSNNPNSGKVMMSCGLKFEGKLRGRMLDKDGIRNDLLSYSITREEYLNNNR